MDQGDRWGCGRPKWEAREGWGQGTGGPGACSALLRKCGEVRVTKQSEPRRESRTAAQRRTRAWTEGPQKSGERKEKESDSRGTTRISGSLSCGAREVSTHTHTPVLKTDLMSWSGFRFTGKLSGSAETSPLLGPALPRATCVQGAQGCGSLRGLPAPGVWTPLCLPAPLLDRQLFPSAQVPVQS